MARKLAAVLSLLAIGVGSALFFSKDGTSIYDEPADVQGEFGFRQRVERRVASDAAWARSLTNRDGANQAVRVPSVTTASIGEPPAESPQPEFQRNHNPVGALLEPVLDNPPRDIPPVAAEAKSFEPPEFNPASATAHKVMDGDTLSRLAERYLGSTERYREIFEANRDVLDNPDLLPIGAVLRIPALGVATTPPAAVSWPGLEGIPPRE